VRRRGVDRLDTSVISPDLSTEERWRAGSVRLLKLAALVTVAAGGIVLLLMNGLTGSLLSSLGCVLIVATGGLQPDRNLRLASFLFAASPLLWISGLIISADPSAPWVVLVSYTAVYCAMLAMLAPLVLLADRWGRRRTGRLSRLLGIPFIRPLAIGVDTAFGSAAALLWAEGVGTDDVAAVHLALFAGVAATTLELLKEDRRLTSTLRE
jgi:hypothetical protein